LVDTAARGLGISLNRAANVGRDESGIANSLRGSAGDHRTIDYDDAVWILNN
jgi:hypothetical protein